MILSIRGFHPFLMLFSSSLPCNKSQVLDHLTDIIISVNKYSTQGISNRTEFFIMTVALSILQLTNFYLAIPCDSQSNGMPLTKTLCTIAKEESEINVVPSFNYCN